MQAQTHIKKHEIIGKRVRSVFRLDLGFEEGDPFYVFVIELESGLRFALERESEIIDPLTNYGLIYPYLSVEQDMFAKKACDIIWELQLELDTSIQPSLDSPIQAVFLPDGGKYYCGLLLENGFVMCDGFPYWGGSILAFYKPKGNALGALDKIFELPED